MAESRIPEQDTGLAGKARHIQTPDEMARMIAEMSKPTEITPEYRKRLDEEYKSNGLDTTQKRIDYLNREFGFIRTYGLDGENLTPEQELNSLEHSWVGRHR